MSWQYVILYYDPEDMNLAWDFGGKVQQIWKIIYSVK